MTTDQPDWRFAKPLDYALWIRPVTGHHWTCAGIGEKTLLRKTAREQAKANQHLSYVCLPQGETPLCVPVEEENDLGEAGA